MFLIGNRDYYKGNPPDLEPYPIDEDPLKMDIDEMVSEHLYEENDLLTFVDIDEVRNERLIEMNQIKENYNGIVSRDGSIKVAKSNVYGKIVNVQGNTVLLKSRIKSYHAEIHKELVGLMDFVEKGDFGYVKWRNGKCWLVGFKKSKKPKKSKTVDKLRNFVGDEKL